MYWTITGAACAALVISLIIKRHSMDKILTSRFSLTQELPVVTAENMSVCVATVPVVAGRVVLPQQLLKETTVGSLLPPISDADSNSIDSRQLVALPTKKSERDAGLRNSTIASSGTATPDVVAYYVEVGGKKVPVEILSAEALSQVESEKAGVEKIAEEAGVDGAEADPMVIEKSDPIESLPEMEKMESRAAVTSGPDLAPEDEPSYDAGLEPLADGIMSLLFSEDGEGFLERLQQAQKEDAVDRDIFSKENATVLGPGNHLESDELSGGSTSEEEDAGSETEFESSLSSSDAEERELDRPASP